MNKGQLALIAELRIWTILINADDEVRGMEPSRVLAHAQRRTEWLEAQLIGIAPYEQEEALIAASEEDTNRAYGQAALNMKATLAMITDERELTS